MDIELRHLRVVCAIAEAGSVTKAATQLGLAQPALTAQLKRIERSLGGELFARDRRGVRPTPLGELVLARARLLLPAVTGLREEAVRLVGHDTVAGNGFGQCRLGATNGPVVGGLVHRFAAACARAGFTPKHLFETDVSGCVDLLVAGQAVVLCQGTFRDLDGVAMVHIAGTPLRWRHLLGWHPAGEAAGVAGEVFASAVAAYGDTVERRPRYAEWLRGHPQFGAVAEPVARWADDH
jgi:DNA-binding transcriptional LysR family regulator